MNKTKIEWVRNPDGTQGYTWNPITGCLNHINGMCKGGGFPCYAYKLAHGRLKTKYAANENIATVFAEGGEPYHKTDKAIAEIEPFYPRFWPDKLDEDLRWCRGIFVCDMSDLFGIGVPEEWTNKVLDRIRRSSHRNHYYLLTKQPQNLIKWSPFPENCWVGVTATTYDTFWKALSKLKPLEARVKFISVEPLLEQTHAPIYEVKGVIDWLIIGQQTPISAKTQPKIEWIKEICAAADKAGIPVFLKNNLYPLLGLGNGKSICHNNEVGTLRQEFPKLK